MKKIILLTGVLMFSFSSFADSNSLEDKVLQLEKKVRDLETRLESLEKRQVVQPNQPVQLNAIKKKTPLLREGVAPIEYQIIQKKFHKAEDKLIDRDDKIQLVFNFTNNFSKQIDVIYGDLYIFDRNGNELLRKSIKVYKPLDFFSSGKIKSGETFKRTIDIIYDPEIPNLRAIKDTPLSDLKVEIKFNKVEFSDETAEFLD